MDESAAEFDLDIMGVLEGTDKSSSVTFSWDYLRHYQTLLAPWRDQPINFIEIGVESGASLSVWKKYFSRAQIVGIDINPGCRRLAGDRVAIETGSQDDPSFLHQVCAKYPPSIIIDDGSHMADHIIYSFRHLFPMLRAGGLYVVEDLEFHFTDREKLAGSATIAVPDYFLELARQRMAHNTSLGELWGDDRYIRDNTDAITFFGGAVAIQKRRTRDVVSALAFADQYLRDAASLRGPSAQTHGSQVDILMHQEKPDEAAILAAEATRLWPDDHGAWSMLSLAKQRLGHADNAIAALERAVAIHPNDVQYHDRLAHLSQQQGELARALTAAKRASALRPDFEPWRRRVTVLEQLSTGAGGS
jgi:hypothetical protein